MDPDRDSLTDVSRYGRKQEGATLLEPPGEPCGPDPATRYALRPAMLFLRAATQRAARAGAVAAWIKGSWRGLGHFLRVRPAVHTAAGSFFLLGRP